mmetsp:Transcript_16191/g.63128  ORF Transcript_16191/g.63128 Transcript_16191/m.63128 type:complete len:231 (+) Transcript_16191:525-1217(+)
MNCRVNQLVETLRHDAAVHVWHLPVGRAEVQNEGCDEEVDAVACRDQVRLKRRVRLAEPRREVIEAPLLRLQFAHDTRLLVRVQRQEAVPCIFVAQLAQVQPLCVIEDKGEACACHLPCREMASSVAGRARAVVHFIQLHPAVRAEVRAMHKLPPADEALWVVATEQVVHAGLARKHDALDLPVLQLKSLLHLGNQRAHVQCLLPVEVVERVAQQLQLLAELLSDVDEVA